MVEVNGGKVGESADLNKIPQGSRVSVYMATELSKRNRPGYLMGLSSTERTLEARHGARARVSGFGRRCHKTPRLAAMERVER